MSKTWKLASGKTWRQKLEQCHPNHGKVVDTPPSMQKRFGKGKMVIPRPRDVDALLKRVRKGRVLTMSTLRAALAEQYEVDLACPLVTGMFVRIVAEAAEETRADGRKRVTPYWRLIRDDGTLFEKFPGGIRAQVARLRAEGLTIKPQGAKRKPRAVDFADRIAHIRIAN